MYKVEISAKTIVFTVIFILSLYFLWSIRDLIYSLFIAFILMSALRPPVIWFEKYGTPRPLAVFIVYLSFISLFIFLFSLIIPPIVIETSNLLTNLPLILKEINPGVYEGLRFDSLLGYLPDATSRIFNLATGIFSNTFFVISTLFFGFYFLLQENILKNLLSRFFEDDTTHKFRSVVEKAERRMSAWFWGELTLMTVVGFLTFIGLSLIGMKYVIALSVLAGLLEVVPQLGPTLSAVPALLIGLSNSYFMGGLVLTLYIVVQQLENNLIVPIIMKNAVGLNPIITLIALLVGGRLGGVIGVLLAIPAYLFLETIFTELILNRTTLSSVTSFTTPSEPKPTNER